MASRRRNGKLWPWIFKKSYLTRGRTECSKVDEDGVSMNSHNNLSGGVLRVPLEDREKFHELYIDDVAKGHVFYFSENFTRVYKMCFDLDFEAEPLAFDDDLKLEDRVRDTEDFRYECYLEIIKTVRRFYPADISPDRFKTVLCEAPPLEVAEKVDVPAHIKMGVHLIFPYIEVKREQALYMISACTTALENKFGKRGEDGTWANSWEDLCDPQVHQKGNLRLLFSDKPSKCPECDRSPSAKPKGPSVCGNPECDRQRVPQHRVYKPTAVIGLDGQLDAILLRQLKANLYTTIRMTSVRSHRSLPSKGFAPYLGCPPPLEPTTSSGKGKGKISGSKRPPIKKDTGHGPKHYLDEKELKSKVLIEMVRKINSHYKKLLFHSAFWTESKTGVKRYFLNVRGEGSLFCLNKGDDHSTSTIYFVISKGGIRQRCFCVKTTDRISGKPCNGYSSDLMVAPLNKLRILFPDIESEFTFKGIFGKNGRRRKLTDDDVSFGCRRLQNLTEKQSRASTMGHFAMRLGKEAEVRDAHFSVQKEKAKRKEHMESGSFKFETDATKRSKGDKKNDDGSELRDDDVSKEKTKILLPLTEEQLIAMDPVEIDEHNEALRRQLLTSR